MTGIETVTIKLGSAVASMVARAWMMERKSREQRGKDLSSIIVARFPGYRQQRTLRRELKAIEEDVADRLEPLIANEFPTGNLPANERVAALEQVVNSLDHADLVIRFSASTPATHIQNRRHRRRRTDAHPMRTMRPTPILLRSPQWALT